VGAFQSVAGSPAGSSPDTLQASVRGASGRLGGVLQIGSEGGLQEVVLETSDSVAGGPLGGGAGVSQG
jgi:hypothetical protein